MLASALRVSPRGLARRSGRHPRRPAVLTGALLGLGLLATGGVPAAVVVGSIAGQPGVSASGAATYRVPIDVAAGMNGLKPDVGLVYSSQSGGWLVGAGWSLAGFSTIARCGHSIALDTRVRGVTFSAEDRFCLDGSPLVMVTSSGTYGGNNIEYRTEVHGYEKVISKSSQSGGPPDSFEVHQPSGLIYTYGFDTAAGSRIATVGLSPNQTRVWALDTITDKFGNQIKFKYASPVAGEFVPDEVTWTSTGSGTGPYKLKFNYTKGQVRQPPSRNDLRVTSRWVDTHAFSGVVPLSGTTHDGSGTPARRARTLLHGCALVIAFGLSGMGGAA